MAIVFGVISDTYTTSQAIATPEIMTYWMLTRCQPRQDESGSAIVIDGEGLPDLSKALSLDHLLEWVRKVGPEIMPEKQREDAVYFWRIIQELHPDDYVVVAHDANTLMLGEITGSYRFEAGVPHGRHVWPVRWVATTIPMSRFPGMANEQPKVIREIPSEEARERFGKYISFRKAAALKIFQWFSIVLLIAELVYFWPRK